MKYFIFILLLGTLACSEQEKLKGRNFKLITTESDNSTDLTILQFRPNNRLEIAVIREMLDSKNDFTLTTYSFVNKTLSFQGKSFATKPTDKGYDLFQNGTLSGRLIEHYGEELNSKIEAEIAKQITKEDT